MIFLLFFFAVPAFSGTCHNDVILGVFPEIPNMTCKDYALLIGFVGLISGYIFWSNAVK